MSDTIIIQLASLFALILAITTHEAAHGFMAKWFGDRTAESMGRLTFNPIAHIDPIGTVLLPALLYFSGASFLLGYAKPVPVNFRNLNPRRLGEIMVAFAGPGTNFLLAYLAALMLHINPTGETFGNDVLLQLIRINLMLGLFNLLPILPMDGGRMVNAMLPPSLSNKYSQMEPYGFFIVLGVCLIPVYQGASLVALILGPLLKFMFYGILVLSGHYL